MLLSLFSIFRRLYWKKSKKGKVFVSLREILFIAADIVFIGLVVIDAVYDLWRRVLPNWVLGGILLAALVRHPLTGKAMIVSCALGALIMSLPLIVGAIIKKGSFGGGDVKLAFAGGWMLGAVKSMTALCISFLSAGAVMLYLTARKRMPSKERGFPFGPFLALGLLVGYFWG